MNDRAWAQRRANRIRAFREELETLTRAGAVTLTSEQREALDRYHDQLLRRLAAEHDIDRSTAAGQLSRGMQIASFFAAVTLTAAVYSLVSRFWGRLEVPVQASLLCAFPLSALIGVELAAQRERTLYVSSIFALVAYGTFWLAVFMLSQLLDVPVTPPAIWAGALFGVSLALPYGFRLVLGVALLTLLVAFAGSVFQVAGVPWTATAEHLDIITAAALVLAGASGPLAAINPSFAVVGRVVGLATGLVGLLVLSSIGHISLLTSSARVSEVVYQAITLVLCVTLLLVAIRKQWSETVYIVAGALTIFLFLRFVDWFWTSVPRYIFFLLLAALAFGWLLALRRLRSRLARGVE